MTGEPMREDGRNPLADLEERLSLLRRRRRVAAARAALRMMGWTGVGLLLALALIGMTRL